MSEKANSRHIKRHSETSNPIFFLDDDPGFRQRISVSRQVRDILENDRYNFSSNGEVIASSTFYNRVLTNILRFNQEPDKLLHIHGIPLLPDADPVAVYGTAEYRTDGMGLRPTNKLRQYLNQLCMDPDLGADINDKYHNNLLLFFRTLLCEYTALAPFERERIYYLDMYKKTEELIAAGNGMTLQAQNSDDFYRVRPYKVMPDVENQYNYLVGLSALNHDEQFHCASFRLSRISDMKSCVIALEPLEKQEIKELKEEISKKGVSFLLGDLIDVRIRLTPKGMEIFNHTQHLRPRISSIKHFNAKRQGEDHDPQCTTADSNKLIQKSQKEEYYELQFICTERQAYNYFFKFGAEARLLSPETLVKDFENGYWEALRRYTKH